MGMPIVEEISVDAKLLKRMIEVLLDNSPVQSGLRNSCVRNDVIKFALKHQTELGE